MKQNTQVAFLFRMGKSRCYIEDVYVEDDQNTVFIMLRTGRCTMRLALVQMENASSMRENLRKSRKAIQEAAKQGADLVLFPEVHLSEFFPQYPGGDATKYSVTLESDIM